MRGCGHKSGPAPDPIPKPPGGQGAGFCAWRCVCGYSNIGTVCGHCATAKPDVAQEAVAHVLGRMGAALLNRFGPTPETMYVLAAAGPDVCVHGYYAARCIATTGCAHAKGYDAP